MVNMKRRHFLSLQDITAEEFYYLLELAAQLKLAKKVGNEYPHLKGKNIALIFEKDSTRTRCAFEVAAYDQGANVTYLGPIGSHIGSKESIKDTARVLTRMYDAIEYRGFDQSIIEQLAHYSSIPVWNGLTNDDHPTQILADFLTMQEHSAKPLQQLSIAYLGDGHNNIAHSLLLGAAKLGLDLRIAAPKLCQPIELSEIYAQAKTSGAKITITDEVAKAVQHVDFLYTDVWVSMGENKAVWNERIALLKPYQINQDVINLTQNPQVKFMHCLPALHNRETILGESIFQQYGLDGVEVTDKIFESAHSIVFDQAENRLHTIKAIMVATLSD